MAPFSTTNRKTFTPLFYLLIHAVSSVFPGTFSKWIGLAVNLAAFAVTLAALYALARRLIGSREWALACVALYGASAMGLSTMLYIRMYMLLTMFSVLLGYVVVLLCESASVPRLLALTAVIFLGLFTQYFFVFIAFFMCAAFDIRCWAHRQWKESLVFSLFAVDGVVLFVAVWPSVITHLTASSDVSGGSALSNLSNLRILAYNFGVGAYKLARLMPAALLAIIVAVALLAKRLVTHAGMTAPSEPLLIVCCSAAIAAVTAVALSPYASARYFYNDMPFVALLACAMLGVAAPGVDASHGRAWLAPLLLACTCAITLIYRPENLVHGTSEYYGELGAHSEAPAVYITTNSNPPATSNLAELCMLEDCVFAESPDAASVTAYLSDQELDQGLVVFIASYPSSQDEEAIVDALGSSYGLTNAEKLDSQDEYSSTYYLSR